MIIEFNENPRDKDGNFTLPKRSRSGVSKSSQFLEMGSNKYADGFLDQYTKPKVETAKKAEDAKNVEEAKNVEAAAGKLFSYYGTKN